MKEQAEKIQGKIVLHLLNLRKILIPWVLFSFLCFIRIIYRYIQDFLKIEYHLLN